MFSPETLLVDYLRHAYFPDRLAGPAHAMSRSEYLTQVNKLNRHFQAWLQLQCEPQRAIALKDLSDELLKFAMCREVSTRDVGGAGNSADTANKLYRHVKAVWAKAVDSPLDGGAQLVPRQCRTKPYRAPKRKPRAWLPDEVEKIVCASFRMPGPVGAIAAADFWPALVLVNMSTGVRINALMSLSTANWDAARGQILVPAETQKQRADQVFDLYPSAGEALRRLDLVARRVPTLFGDWPWDIDRAWRVLRKHLRRLLVTAGLFERVRDVTRRDLFHKFRKTVGTEIAISRGIAAAQLFLGHSSTQVTELYIDERRVARVTINDVMPDPAAHIMRPRLYGETA